MFVDFSLHKDEFHVNAEDIYLVGNVIEKNGKEIVWGDSPSPLPEALRRNCPTVKNAVGVVIRSITAIRENERFREDAYFVDKQFLEMFTFSLKEGDLEYFDDPSSVYVTERMAKKYFGDEKAIGKEIGVVVGNGERQQKIIRGIFQDHNIDSSLDFEFLLTRKSLETPEFQIDDDWRKWIRATFVQMNQGENPESINETISESLVIQREIRPDWPIQRLYYYSLFSLTRSYPEIRNPIISGNDISALISIGLLSFIILLLACFNYTNNMIVILSRRFKEIGIRKVIGSSRKQIAFQFLGENLLFIMIAVVGAVFLTKYFVLPGMFYAFEGGWDMRYFQLTHRAIIYFASILVLTALGSGIYPSLVVSKFVPANIIRGKMNLPGQNVLIKILITMQFFLTFMVLVFPITLIINTNYQKSLDWGYDKEGVYVVPVKNGSDYEILRNKIDDNPNIKEISGAGNHIGYQSYISAITYETERYEVKSFRVGKGYLEMMGLHLIEGSSFNQNKQNLDEYVVNQAFVKELDWENPIGKIVSRDTLSYQVVGVVEDFHATNFENEIDPCYLRLVEEDEYKMMLVKIEKSQLASTAAMIEKSFKELFPDLRYTGRFQDGLFDNLYRSNKEIASFFSATAVIALLIAVMGLFGLVSATLAKKEKEIGIRKVLGATVSQIINIITKPILIILMLGSGIALIPTWLLIKLFMDGMYAYHIGLNPIPFLIGFGILFFASLFTMLLQTVKSAHANPVKTLRNE